MTRGRRKALIQNRRRFMRVSPGVRLGLYDILAPLGAGGCGERVVADAERDAQLLVALNHPHIERLRHSRSM